MTSKMKKLVLTLMIGVLTLGSLGAITAFNRAPEAQARNYNSSSPNVALALAYYDAYRSVDDLDEGDSKRTAFQNNINSILGKNSANAGKRFANIGLMIGPRTEGVGGAMDQFLNPNTLSEASILAGYPFPTDDAKAYQAFGIAIHNTIAESLQVSSETADIETALDGIANTGRKMSTIGMRLLKDYNPGPIVEAFYDASALTQYPDNKLVAMVMNSPDLKNIITMMGSPIGEFSVAGRAPSLTLVLLTLIVVGLLIASVLMRLANGRAAGESIRKIMVRVLVSAIALPITVTLLNSGVNWVVDVTESVDENSYISITQTHLNMADWYSLGFPIPPGEKLVIDANGNFDFTPDLVKKINDYTYRTITGKEATPEKVKERLDAAGGDNKNRSVAVFHKPATKEGWNTKPIYDAAEKLALNDTNDPVKIFDFVTAGYEYFRGGTTEVVANAKGYTVINGSGDTRYGISPISAYNLMNSTFTKTGITAQTKGGFTFPSVAYYVGSGAPTEAGLKTLNPLVNIIATFTMIMAALQGLFSILTNGFGGIISGGAKSTLGSSAGFGQALGGVLAVVGGVFGIGLIMTISFGLLGELQAIITELFWYGAGETSVIDQALEPIRIALKKIPLLGGIAFKMAQGIIPLMVSLIGMLAIPKFGAIPIRVFSEKMAELPNAMADRAQQLENRFTGDYHAGGGYGGGGSGSIGSQMGQAISGATAGAKGVALGGAAILGGAASLAGSKLESYADGDSTNNDGSLSSDSLENEFKSQDDQLDAMSSETTNEGSDDNQEVVDTTLDDNNVENINDTESSQDSMVGVDTQSTADNTQSSEQTNEGADGQSIESNSDQVSSEKSLSSTSQDSDTEGFTDKDTEIAQSSEQISQATLATEGANTQATDTLGTDGGASHSSQDKTMSMSNTEGDKVAINKAEAKQGVSSDATGPQTGQSLDESSKDSKPTASNKRRSAARLLGKTLSAAGGNRTAGQAIKQMAVGATHAAASAAGLQNVTQGQLNKAVRKDDTSDQKKDTDVKTTDPAATKKQNVQARRNRINRMEYERSKYDE